MAGAQPAPHQLQAGERVAQQRADFEVVAGHFEGQVRGAGAVGDQRQLHAGGSVSVAVTSAGAVGVVSATTSPRLGSGAPAGTSGAGAGAGGAGYLAGCTPASLLVWSMRTWASGWPAGACALGSAEWGSRIIAVLLGRDGWPRGSGRRWPCGHRTYRRFPSLSRHASFARTSRASTARCGTA